MVRSITRAALSLLVLLATAAAVHGQSLDWTAMSDHMTRPELEEQLARFQEAAGSEGYSRQVRQRAEREAASIQRRLTEGDFQIGDRIYLEVEGHQDHSGEFTVRAGPAVILPVIGEISLRGVLRSELQTHLQQEIGRFIREPVVRARSQMRVLVSGAVGNPGFYAVETDALITDLLMTAGGPNQNADLMDIRIERGQDQRIWEGEPLQEAITQGRTLDQLNLQAGDRIVVPAATGSQTWTIIRTALFLVPSLAWTYIRLFRR